MLIAGVAWGVYSLRGMGSADPGRATAGNFLRAAPLALLLSLTCVGRLHGDRAGFLYAALSGALASGVGYALWYRALKGLRAATAASVQLTVPVFASLAGVTLLGEAFTARLALASAAILFGLFLVLRHGSPAPHRP
jgi:drug/metabolite transporter (DMT)-like permease